MSMNPTPFAIGLRNQGIYSFTMPTALQPVFPGTYTPGAAVTYHAEIAQPRQVQHTPPEMIGTDTNLHPVVRGYAQMTWSYPMLKPDRWYYLYNLWRIARATNAPYTGWVRIVWPEPLLGTQANASARWDGISSVSRDVAAFYNITLTFSHLGIDDGGSVAGTWIGTP